MKQSIKPRPQISTLVEGVLQGDRLILSQAITLIESKLEEDQRLSAELLEKIIHTTGNSVRVGITGVPGVGKSSFIEAFGSYITSLGKKLAILSIDPSSQLTKGSILADKTRMESLSKNPLAYIRPTPSGNTLGGVADKTHDAILLCEAAGFEVIIVETVGVGQSEISVKNLVDFFLLLMLAGAGDELQGMKKGIVEMADAIAITKADGENIRMAQLAKSTYQQALHLKPAEPSEWTPKVLITSALSGEGIQETWKMILSFKNESIANGSYERKRNAQRLDLLHHHFTSMLYADLEQRSTLSLTKESLREEVVMKKLSPKRAAEKLLDAYHQDIRTRKS